MYAKKTIGIARKIYAQTIFFFASVQLNGRGFSLEFRLLIAQPMALRAHLRDNRYRKLFACITLGQFPL